MQEAQRVLHVETDRLRTSSASASQVAAVQQRELRLEYTAELDELRARADGGERETTRALAEVADLRDALHQARAEAESERRVGLRAVQDKEQQLEDLRRASENSINATKNDEQRMEQLL